MWLRTFVTPFQPENYLKTRGVDKYLYWAIFRLKWHRLCFYYSTGTATQLSIHFVNYHWLAVKPLTLVKFGRTGNQVILMFSELVLQLTKGLVYTSDFARCDFHPGVRNQLTAVCAARYSLMIGSSLSSTLSSVEHILQDVNRKAQNRTSKQPLTVGYLGRYRVGRTTRLNLLMPDYLFSCILSLVLFCSPIHPFYSGCPMYRTRNG